MPSIFAAPFAAMKIPGQFAKFSLLNIFSVSVVSFGLFGCGGGSSEPSHELSQPSAIFMPDSLTVKTGSSTILGIFVQTPDANSQRGGGTALIYPVKWAVEEAGGGTLADAPAGSEVYHITYIAPAVPGLYHVTAAVGTTPPTSAVATITVSN